MFLDNMIINKVIVLAFGYARTVPLSPLWIGVFFISGIFGAYAWMLLKMVFPMIGVIGILINIILFIIFLVKKKKSNKLMVNFIINIGLTFPILMTMNIIAFAYPNDLDRVKPAITVKWPLGEPTVVEWGEDRKIKLQAPSQKMDGAWQLFYGYGTVL
jgi:hypothetical protein